MPENLTGQRIGQYTITEKIGEGGMGAVWKARDEKLGRYAALKFLGRLDDADRRVRFGLEARAASVLNHPGIVTIYDILEPEGRACIAMEYVEGQTLGKVIPAEGLTAKELLALAIQMADALAAAHKGGVVHRDLKPGNVMVTPEGRAKLLDFGLAKLAEITAPGEDGATQTVAPSPHTAQGAILGTVNYMSPEQAQGKPVDARSDIFSLGTVFYEMATGRKAFSGETTISTITAILRDEPKPISGAVPTMPREVERVIARCLRKEPERRFQTAIDVRNALEEAQEELRGGSTVRLPESSPVTVASTVKPTSRFGLMGAGVVLLTALGAGGAWLVTRKTEAPPAAAVVVRTLLENLPGKKSFPSFSPDGRMIVFSWDGGVDGQNSDIYVTLANGEGTPVRLTSTPATTQFLPFYSPDGSRIYFSRTAAETIPTIYSIPALGGAETRVARGAQPDLSPDGLWICWFSETAGLRMRHLGTGQERELAPGSIGAISAPKFSPDSQWIYFTLQTATGADARRVAIAGGAVEPVAVPALRGKLNTVTAVQFASGGGAIAVYGETDNRPATFLLDRNWANPRLLPPNVTLGVLAPDGKRAVRTVRTRVAPVYRMLAFPGTAKPTAEKVLDSPRAEDSPQWSPDGTRMVVSSWRTGPSELWLWDAKMSNGRAVFDQPSSITGSPAWSPDGQWIAFDSRVGSARGDIWVMRATGDEARRLTQDPSEEINPCFDQSGENVYFSSSRTGTIQLFRVPFRGGPAVQVTKGGGYTCQASADGKYIYYLQERSAANGLWRIDLAGGREEMVFPTLQNRNWKLLSDGVYFLDVGDRSAGAGGAVRGEAKFYRFSTRRVEKLGFSTPRPIPAVGIDVSADRKWVYFPMMDRERSELQLTENLP